MERLAPDADGTEARGGDNRGRSPRRGSAGEASGSGTGAGVGLGFQAGSGTMSSKKRTSAAFTSRSADVTLARASRRKAAPAGDGSKRYCRASGPEKRTAVAPGCGSKRQRSEAPVRAP